MQDSLLEWVARLNRELDVNWMDLRGSYQSGPKGSRLHSTLLVGQVVRNEGVVLGLHIIIIIRLHGGNDGLHVETRYLSQLLREYLRGASYWRGLLLRGVSMQYGRIPCRGFGTLFILKERVAHLRDLALGLGIIHDMLTGGAYSHRLLSMRLLEVVQVVPILLGNGKYPTMILLVEQSALSGTTYFIPYL